MFPMPSSEGYDLCRFAVGCSWDEVSQRTLKGMEQSEVSKVELKEEICTHIILIIISRGQVHN
jgi:hypothetical protein